MKRWYRTLKILLGCSIGVLLGSGLYRYFDFKARPELYAMQPAPWYQPLILQGLFTAGAAAVLLLMMRLLKNKDKKG